MKTRYYERYILTHICKRWSSNYIRELKPAHEHKQVDRSKELKEKKPYFSLRNSHHEYFRKWSKFI